ncbi:helix-turn-helix domain-containing protein [Rhodobacter sp. NSM]|uniref:helix-turn-helix domain-containing protein n=1 Tax=Rhodobacter sp. NSM TaxID=3457501 RepID=UPI003FD53042
MTDSAGDLIRQWRQRRGLSQLALAANATISQRHLSFVESGRSRPSRDMVLHLGEHLGVPLRERNVMLTAAGFAPYYPQSALAAPEMRRVRDLIQRLIDGHMPHPALAVDRHWTLIAANAAVQALLAGVAPHLLAGEVNVLRLSLHPEGLAPRILNLREWRHHLLTRLSHDIEVSADPALAALREELAAMPMPAAKGPEHFAPAREARIAVPLRLQTEAGPVSYLSTTTVFGTATDIALSEVTIEAFFPTDAGT